MAESKDIGVVKILKDKNIPFVSFKNKHTIP